jgi:hypothetical protein
MLMELGPNMAQPEAENRRRQKLIRIQFHLFLGNEGLIVIILLKENILGLHRLE